VRGSLSGALPIHRRREESRKKLLVGGLSLEAVTVFERSTNGFRHHRRSQGNRRLSIFFRGYRFRRKGQRFMVGGFRGHEVICERALHTTTKHFLEWWCFRGFLARVERFIAGRT
jgi:hypothetical protein